MGFDDAYHHINTLLQLLLGSAQQMALDRHQPPDAALRLGAVLALQTEAGAAVSAAASAPRDQ